MVPENELRKMGRMDEAGVIEFSLEFVMFVIPVKTSEEFIVLAIVYNLEVRGKISHMWRNKFKYNQYTLIHRIE